MASVNTNSLLRCNSCSKRLHQPGTLACSHTFCRPCILSYNITRSETVHQGALACPFCQHLTTVPDRDKPLEEWPGQIEPSLVVRGILEASENNSAQVLCDLCVDEGETITAVARCPTCDVALCEACLKAHRRNPASRNHDIADIATDVRSKQRYKLMCKDHKDEVIQFYCKDCRKDLCQICYNCKHCHKNCKNLLSLESMMSEMITSLQDNTGVLMAIVGNQKSKVTDLQSKLDSVLSLKSSFQDQISSRFKMIRDILKSKEMNLMDNLDRVVGPSIERLEKHMKEAKMATDVSEQQSQLISHVLESQNEMYLFETYLSCRTSVVQMVDGLVTEPDHSCNVPDISFVQDTDNLMQRVQELDAGHFEIKTDEAPEEDKTQPLALQTVNTASTRVPGEKEKASPTDVLVVEVNGEHVVVLTDWGGNHTVKSFFIRNGKPCNSKLSLPGGPYSLCQLKDKTIAVTLPDCKQIIKIEATPELKLMSSVSTKKEYWGLTALTSSTLAAGCQTPSSVDVIDMTGSILRSLRPRHNDAALIKYPNFLCSNKEGHILVSDCGTKSVSCLTPDGKVVFSYTPTGDQRLKSPRGLSVTQSGDILVADFSLHNVVQLSSSGVFLGDVTSDDVIQYPHGICVDGSGRIHVSLYAEGVIKTFLCTPK